MKNKPCRRCGRPVEIYAWKICERKDCIAKRKKVAYKKKKAKAQLVPVRSIEEQKKYDQDKARRILEGNGHIDK